MSLPDTVALLVEAGACAPSADNSQPWRFRWAQQQLSLLNGDERAAGATFPRDHPATYMAMGAANENMLQAARATSIELEASTQNAGGEFCVIRILSDGVALGKARQIPLFQRCTNRLPYKTIKISKAILDGIIAPTTSNNARIIVLDRDGEIAEAARLVRSASEVRFQTKEIHEWFSSSLRFSQTEVDAGDGLDVSTFYMPPGGRYFLQFIRDWRRMERLNKIGAYKFLSRIEAATVAKAPLLLAIVGPPGLDAALAAGQLMERAWIELNRQGLAVQPYYVLSDQLQRLADGFVPPHLVDQIRALRRETQQLLALGDNIVYILLRVGYPYRSPVRSRRLPLHQVFSENS